ncbi:MAG: hypothetical protein AAFP78_12510, partial [Pseudomonadota bacterium]
RLMLAVPGGSRRPARASRQSLILKEKPIAPIGVGYAFCALLSPRAMRSAGHGISLGQVARILVNKYDQPVKPRLSGVDADRNSER